jgi:hypothetical protein
MGVSSVFVSFAPDPAGWFGFTIFMSGYLEKGARGERGTLKQGEQENSFGQYSSLSKQFEIRTYGYNFDCKEPCKVHISQSM